MEVTVTLGLLDELQRLGFNDDAFWRLHHFRRVGRPDSIARHRNYCMGLKRGVFNPGSENERVALRLSFVLDTVPIRLTHTPTTCGRSGEPDRDRLIGRVRLEAGVGHEGSVGGFPAITRRSDSEVSTAHNLRRSIRSFHRASASTGRASKVLPCPFDPRRVFAAKNGFRDFSMAYGQGAGVYAGKMLECNFCTVIMSHGARPRSGAHLACEHHQDHERDSHLGPLTSYIQGMHHSG